MNAAEIRKLIAEHDMAGLDKLEQEVTSMDDEANDVSVLGDTLTNILGAKRVLEEAEKQVWSPKWRCAPSSKTSGHHRLKTRPRCSPYTEKHKQVDRRHLPIFVEVGRTHVLDNAHQTRPVVKRGARVNTRGRPSAS